MTNLNLSIANYSEAEARMFEEVYDLVAATDALLSRTGSRRTVHSGPTRNVRNPVVLDQPFEMIEHGFKLPFDVIRSTDTEQYTILVYQLADDFKQSTSQSMFRIIDATTEAVGNKFDAQGDPISHDRVTDMIERIHISFDNQGNHNLSLVLPPEHAKKLASIPLTEEQAKRRKQVIDRKREEFYATKPTRKLY